MKCSFSVVFLFRLSVGAVFLIPSKIVVSLCSTVSLRAWFHHRNYNTTRFVPCQ